ncbi:MAG: protease pro-enzyme activation domain-containing protein, partial [Solirubrobacteraceae bacterium]
RHFRSSAAVTARFGPSITAYDDVVSWLRARGFSRLRGSADRLTVTAVASRAVVQRTFDVALRDFRLGGRRVYANTTNPAIPVALAPYVGSVVGLSDVGEPQPLGLPDVGEPQPLGHPSPVTAADVQIPIGPCNVGLGTLVQGDNPCKDVLADSCWDLLKAYAESAFGGEVIEDEKNFQCAADELDLVTAYAASLRKASVARAGVIGARTAPGGGEKLGLLEFDTLHRSDVSNFLALQGDSASQVSQLMSQLSEQPVDGGVATPGAWEAEVLLDVDAALSLAPGAQVVVYDAPMSGTGFVDEFNAMIADHVNVISNSWVTCENLVSRSEAQAIDTVLQQAAAAGISVLNATGDTGSSCFGTPDTVAVPADSPSATAVGGSSMTPGVDGTYGGEAWWDGSAATPSGGQGGYGVSRYFPRPSYQDSFTSASGRSVPDIVSNADPFKGYSICQADAGGCLTGGLFGGTSVAAPMLAALVADLDEQLGHPLGQLNQLLYPLANSTTFHTATSMHSDFAHVGLGSPNLDRLSLAISGQSPGPVDVTASDANHSTLEGLPVPGIPADGTTPDLLVAKLVDANGNTVAGKDVTLAPVGTPAGKVTITPVGSSTSSNENGTVEFAVTDTVPETVTFQATDTTDKLVLPTLDVQFVSPPADAGEVQPPNPSNPPADGTSTSTITVALQYKGAGVSGKTVTLTPDSGTHSAIVATGATPGVTDASGNATFQVSDATAESVTYTAVDVTDGGLQIPNTVTVDFGGSAVNNEACAANSSQSPTAGAGFAFTNFATNFGVGPGSCQGPIGIAFDSSGDLYAEDTFGNELYRFGPQGGSAGASTLVGTVTGNGARISGMAFGKDGELYAGEYCGDMVQLDPATAKVVRTVVPNSSSLMPCPTGVAVDPLSGDLFASNVGAGVITRIPDPAGQNPTAEIYAHVQADGIAFAPDGTMYLAGLDQCIYSLPGTDQPGTPTPTQITCLPGTNPDGMAVEPAPGSTHAQALFVNTNSGAIYEIPLANPSQPTTVFSGGSRGDFVTVGPDGCMYATQSDRIIRLTAVADGQPSCPFAPTASGPQINLVQTSPGTSTGQTGGQASFKATLENVPSPGGTPITFTVSGSSALAPISGSGGATGPGNSQRDLVDAGSDGSGTLSYTGVHTGIDEVVARANINGTEVTSPPVQFTWTAGVDKTWLGLNASPDGGTPGDPTTLSVSLLDLSGTPQPTPIGDASVTVSLQGQSCTAHTDAAGNGSCTVTPPGPVGLTAVTAAYAGDAMHLPARASDPFV